MHETRPGLHPQRLVRLMRAAVERCQLDLSGSVVLTEAASGAYVVTPILAALAGATRVYALTRTTRYGTVADITAQTRALAELVGVQERIEIITQKTHAVVAEADIITNSGHVRPIDAEMIGCMRPTAVIPLMYETWELREGDVDIAACRRRGIAVAGTNERHPAVDVFSFLGIMALKLLVDAGVSVYASHILLLCDNAFAPFIIPALVKAGAKVATYTHLAAAPPTADYDVVLVALQPRAGQVLTAADAERIAGTMPGVVIAQYWGDIDRDAFEAAGLPVWPFAAPPRGHMGILPSAIGPDPILRLQAGGLKVAEILSRHMALHAQPDRDFVQLV